MTDVQAANKDVRDLLKRLLKRGCEISRTGNGHFRVSLPGCRAIIVANSPSDPRTTRNIKADARRYLGIDL